MNPSREEQLFELVLEKPPAERAGFLKVLCGEDEALRQRIETLLEAHNRNDSFMGGDASDKSTIRIEMEDKTPPEDVVGETIGRYRLLQKVGEGGCGVVYVAEQQKPVRRRIALKVIKLGMDTKNVVARFEAERQALALMDHPNIAKVLDAGATESGRPYFVMELVRGIKITEYCDQNRLSTDERLDLFIQICHAIQHAHQKGIIHRDIKPSNILITLHDGVPIPKVIDFGIAKATEGRLTDLTVYTELHQFIGTPAYMSPEQAEMSGLDVDTRSDIYSLGVLLYELLTGRTPFDGKELMSMGIDAMRQAIREKEPPRPSTKLSTLVGEDLTTTAQRRSVEPSRLASLLRGDLDWIVMKCLEKDRTRRYETANGLAMDIQRHLSNEPVVARPPSKLYEFQKTIRRHKVGFAATAAVIVALACGVVLTAWQAARAIRAEREQTRLRQRAETEAVRSAQVAEFLKDTLRAAGPGVARGRDATLLREVLEKTAARVESDLSEQPEVQGDLWFTLGATYWGIGDMQQALPMFEKAVASYRTALGEDNAKLAGALGKLGRCQSFLGDTGSGSKNARLGLEMARRCGEPEVIATALRDLGLSLDTYGNPGLQAAPFLREAVEIRRRIGKHPLELAKCLTALADSLRKGADPEAEALAHEALALYRQHLEPGHPAIAEGVHMVGQVLIGLGEFERAEPVLCETVGLFEQVYDEDHPSQRFVLYHLGIAFGKQGKWEALGSFLQGKISERGPWEGYWCNLLGAWNADQGNCADAIDQFTRAVELRPDRHEYMFNLAVALLREGHEDEYRVVCSQLLNLVVAGKASFGPNEMAAKAGLLLPVSSSDYRLACRLADLAWAAERPPMHDHVAYLLKALVDYRRGKLESARDWATQAISDQSSTPPTQSAGWFILACLHVRSGDMTAGRSALARGNAILADHSLADFGRDWWHAWREWAASEHLHDEAVSLLETQAAGGEAKPKN